MPRQNVVRIARHQQMDHGYVAQLGRAAHHGADELLGFRASGMNVDAGSASNRAHRFIRGAACSELNSRVDRNPKSEIRNPQFD